MEQFGDKIIKLRTIKGLSQQELSDNIGIKRSSLGMYERNERKPGFDVLRKFANYFGVTTDYLMGLNDDASGGLEYQKLLAEATSLAEELKATALLRAQGKSTEGLRDLIKILNTFKRDMGEK